jgi:hypothetical protein
VSKGDKGVVGDNTGDMESSGGVGERVGASDQVFNSSSVVDWRKAGRVGRSSSASDGTRKRKEDDVRLTLGNL